MSLPANRWTRPGRTAYKGWEPLWWKGSRAATLMSSACRSRCCLTSLLYSAFERINSIIKDGIIMEIHGNVLRDVPHEERPRERMMRYGAEALSHAELLAILLRTGTRKQSAVHLAG